MKLWSAASPLDQLQLSFGQIFLRNYEDLEAMLNNPKDPFYDIVQTHVSEVE